MTNLPKIKVYRNSKRNVMESHKPYVPQYQVMGIEPTEYKSPLSPGYPVLMTKIPIDSNNTKVNRPSIRQPYAETIESPIGIGRGPLPNVGNNLEQTWSGVDNIIDDLSVDSQDAMVDNNDFVSDAALGTFEELPSLDETITPSRKNFIAQEEKSFLTQDVLQDVLTSEYLSSIISQMSEDEYLLIVSGNTICSGPLEYIQEQTTALVFGEHELYHDNPVSIDDIIVLKKVPIKVGVFLF